VNNVKNDGSRKIHLFLLLVIVAVFIWSAIKPASYLTWALEVSPAVVGLIIVIAVYNKFRFTTLSYVIMTILAIIMFVGGHYIYSKVPLFDWIKDAYDLKRNHYDRFGHLLKGLFAIVLREILLRKTPLTKGPWLFTIVISMSLAISALYEIIEWLVSKISKGGEASKNFLGIQGDIWDTQWDMLCSLIGSIAALLILSKLHDKLLKKEAITPKARH
jgi:putative membrane protein